MCIPRSASVSTLVALVFGCGGEGSPTFTVRLHVPPSATPDGRCPPTASFVPMSSGAGRPTSLRLTWRDPATRSILCDAVIPTEGNAARVGVPRTDSGEPAVADLVVETFRDDGAAMPTLIASGEARGVDLGDAGEVPLLLAPREQFACAAGRMVVPRAFHSATPLPNGEMLIAGGVVAIPGPSIDLGVPAGGGFFASDGVEIYYPGRGTFRSLPVVDLVPRAMHQAYLLPLSADGAFQILLLGGLTVSGDARQTPILDGVRDMVEPMRLVPSPQAQAAPTEILTYDPRTGVASRRPVEGQSFAPRLFQAASRPPTPHDVVPATPPVVAGGWRTYTAELDQTFEVVDVSTASRLGPITPLSPAIARIGATVTHLENDRALIFGGNLSSPGGMETFEVGHVLDGLSTGMPTAAPLAVDAMAPPPARAFHTAVAIGPNRVLISGGFVVAGGSAVDPAAPFAFLLTVDPAMDNATVINVPFDAQPAGYADATPILGGDVLITGGSPTTSFACPDEPMASYLCALRQAHRFVRSSDALVPVGDLIVARWGHRAVPLAEGTVLVTGGLRYDNALLVVGDTELWNPRTERFDPASDDPAIAGNTMVRAAGDIARNLDGTPARECFVE